MKKILLVPLMAISLLVGCNTNKQEEEQIVTLQDWLTNNDPIENECKYFIGVGHYGDCDYENYVANELLDDVYGRPEKTNVDGGRALLTYHVKKECGPYTECYIFVHENTIEVESYKNYYIGNKPDQHLVYEYYSAFASNFLIKAYRRADEVGKIKEEEYEAALEASKLDNFYKQIEESTTNPIATFSNVTKEDVGHALLDDIKDLFNPLREKSFDTRQRTPFMSYGLNEDFLLNFYLNNNQEPVAVIEYKYQSSLGYTNKVDIGYSVSREKVDNLINKITGAAH